MSEFEQNIIAILKSINAKLEALLEALQPHREHPRVEEEKIEIQEELLMDLTDVIFMAESSKAVLVVKKGFQKWVAFSLIKEPKEITLGFQGNIVLRIKNENEKTDPENWFHNKPWEKFKPQKKGG